MRRHLFNVDPEFHVSKRRPEFQMMMALPRRLTLILPLLVGVTACITTDGGTLPSDSVEVEVDLPPGASATYEFEIEVETTDSDESIRLITPFSSLIAQGVQVERSWTHGGIEEEGWPERFEIGANEQTLADLHLTLTNGSQTRVEFKMRITITGDPAPGGPTEDDLHLTIRRG